MPSGRRGKPPCACSCPVAGSEPAYAGNLLIAEPVHIDGIEFAPPSKKDICALCHGGPMLNMVNQVHSDFVGGSPPLSVIPRAFFAEMFKIPTLWGIADTAPYFHNNGATTLRDAVAHYQRFFNFTEAQDPVGSRSLGGFITLTDADVDDIVAYLKLLGPNRRRD